MNMISTGAFQTEMDASNKQETLVTKLVKAWEKKNAKVARAGGVSLMALSLAACGSSDDTTTTDASTDTSTDTTTTVTVAESKDFTLTTGQNAGSSFKGDSGDDTYSSLTTTLTVGDNLDGAGGTDTLTLSSNLNGNTTVAGWTTTNIENFTIGLTSGAAGAETLTVNLLNSSATTVTVSGTSVSGASDTVALTNVAGGTTVALASSTDIDVTATFATAATKGTADSVSVSLGSTSMTAGGDGVVTITAGFETMDLASTGAANVIGDLVFGGTTLNITGDQNLTVDAALDASLDLIDATAATGKLDLTTANDTTTPDATVGGVDVVDITVKGGSGNDNLDLTNNATNNEILVEAGAGDDTIHLGATPVNAGAAIAGDVIKGGDGTDTLNVDVDIVDGGTAGITGLTTITGISGVEALSIDGFAAEANTVNLSNISSEIATVTVASATGGNLTINAAGSLTVNVGGAAAILDNDTLTVDSGAGTEDTLLIANTNKATTTNQIGANDTSITTTDFETVTIDSGTYNTATPQLVAAINVGTANALVLTGGNGITTTATTGIITAKTIDASGLSGGLIMNVAAASGVTTITGGAGADTLVGDAASTIDGGDGNDTITGGSGNDTLTGGAGKDAITTGAGNDTVVGGAGNDTITVAGNLTSADSIDGGDGTDTISLDNTSLTALNALGVSAANTFNANFNNVEKATISNALNQASFDAGYLDGVTHWTLAAGMTGAETLTGLPSGATVEAQADLTAALTIGVTNAATGTNDAVTVLLSEGAGTDYTSVAIADVEEITVDVTEGTANNTVRAATLGMAITKSATTKPAQTVKFVGTESLTVDTAIAAETITAAGMTTGLVTEAGLTMSTAHTAAQTITGSGKVDTIYGSTKADTINAGAGNDTIYGGTGGDTIDGGAGTDTWASNAADTAANIDGTGTGTSTGMVVNLGATALTDANILGTVAQNISGSLTSVGSGQAAYVYNGSLSSNSASLDTITNVENITMADGINYVVGSATANTINGGSGTDWITGGNGADTITGNADADTITLTETAANSAADIVKYTFVTEANVATETGAAAGTDNDFVAGTTGDKIVGFVSGTDKIHVKATSVTNAIGTEVDTLKSIAAAGTVANTDRFVEITTAQANGQMGTAITLLDGLTTTAVAINDSFIAFINDGTDGYLYYVEQQSTANTIAAQDVTLIAQLTGVTDLADGDLVTY